MEPYLLAGLLTLLYPLFSPCTCLLDNVGDADLKAVRYRLQDEKEKRLLLENDVETMMLKLAELERLIKKDRNKTEVTSSTQCAYAFVSHANHCYLYVGLAATWIEAQMYCRVFGGSLVSIETQEEWIIIRSYLESVKAHDVVWIDGTDILKEGMALD
ncbi:hypothetical protein ACJMK2_007393 [Sinanodonta woodiana]|uniref:C-type lectin domain-containing protein n=1 Tax=Sinanodonta woodiana TaxID=1069815 RepID=A0ABD3VIM8_SINWO